MERYETTLQIGADVIRKLWLAEKALLSFKGSNVPFHVRAQARGSLRKLIDSQRAAKLRSV